MYRKNCSWCLYLDNLRNIKYSGNSLSVLNSLQLNVPYFISNSLVFFCTMLLSANNDNFIPSFLFYFFSHPTVLPLLLVPPLIEVNMEYL